MQLNPQLIKNHFKKSIDKYERHGIVQALMADKLVAALRGDDFENILELGCGSGLLTKKLVENVNYKEYYANDIVDKSKVYLDKILKDYVFLCGDAQKINVNRKFDLIISNALFQWFGKLEKVLNHYSNKLKSGGIIAFTTFGQDNYKEIKSLTGLSLDYMCVEEIEKIVTEQFELKSLEKFDYTLTFSNPLEVLLHMKNTGVNALGSQQWGVREVKEFCDRYKSEYPEITLTYSPIIVVAQKR